MITINQLVRKQPCKITNKTKVVLPQILYTSGVLHAGHLRVYTLSDIIHRAHLYFKKDSILLCGFDAYGLPADNAAKQHNINPRDWTNKNMEDMASVMCQLNFDITGPILNTSSEEYEVSEQKIFVDLYNAGFIYKGYEVCNWDPVDKIILADEQIIDGRGWRSGCIVEKKLLQSFFFRSSSVLEAINNRTSGLEWPDSIKKAQLNWIGRFEIQCADINIEGINLSCRLIGIEAEADNSNRIDIDIRNPNITKLFTHSDVEAMLQDIDKGPIYRQVANYHIYISDSQVYSANMAEIRLLLNSPLWSKAKTTTIFKMRDWSIGRDRMWGCEIPMVDEKVSEDFIRTYSDRGVDKRPTLDTFFDSAWYPIFWGRILGRADIEVSDYIGGPEHATTHLIYARMIYEALNRLGYNVSVEPFKKLYTIGTVQASAYYDKTEKKYICYKEYQARASKENIVVEVNQKMSKSKLNGVAIDELLHDCNNYGDILRLAIMSDAPYSQNLNWQPNQCNGPKKLYSKLLKIKNNVDLYAILKSELNEGVYLEEMEHLLKEYKFNIFISRMYVHASSILTNKHTVHFIKDFLRLVSIICPSCSE